MAQTLYRNLWVSEEVRTFILGTFLLSICILLELIFIFFPTEIETSILGFLFWELGTFTPLLTIFHIIIWEIMFFSTLMDYAVVREYTGGRTGLLEIGVITLLFTLTSGLIFNEWFVLFFLAFSILIIGYMYLALADN
ncbi:MAG: hypothetical protein ACXAC8_00200 [Candidatus Hodarchaeales archaeon]|jgi:hypothetical protein